jgi:hypothetical protein
MDKKGKLAPCCVCAFVELTCRHGDRKVGKMGGGRARGGKEEAKRAVF